MRQLLGELLWSPYEPANFCLEAIATDRSGDSLANKSSVKGVPVVTTYRENDRERENEDSQRYREDLQGELQRADHSDSVPALLPSSWDVKRREEDMAYSADARLRNARALARHAVDAIVETHEYITERTKGMHPALESEVRQIEMAVAQCSALLIARYMGR